jgi:hypothetical protein
MEVNYLDADNEDEAAEAAEDELRNQTIMDGELEIETIDFEVKEM